MRFTLGQAQHSAGDVAAARQQIESALTLFRQRDIPGEIALGLTRADLADCCSAKDDLSFEQFLAVIEGKPPARCGPRSAWRATSPMSTPMCSLPKRLLIGRQPTNADNQSALYFA